MWAEPCSGLLTSDVTTFVHSGVAVIVASANAELVPALTRGAAPRVAADRRTIDVFVGRAQSRVCLTNLAPGRPIAVTLVDPTDYGALQIKGLSAGHRDADDEDRDWHDRYWSLFMANMQRVGIVPARAKRLSVSDIVRLTFAPTAIFHQTPGPGAGRQIAEGQGWE
jgi:hypothetical protein